jgi:hypothetical protein
MKSSASLFASALIWLMASTSFAAAQGYQGPWCAVFSLGFSTVQERCGFASFEMCRREALHYGSSAFCRQNSWYAPYWGVGEPRARAPAKKRHRRAH